MNLDIQPNNVTILIHADSIQQAIQQLARAKTALQTMMQPAPMGDEELQTLLTELAALRHVPQPAAANSHATVEEPATVETAEPDETTPQGGEPITTEPKADNGNEEPDATELPSLADLQADYNKGGQDVFAQEWAQASPWLIKRYTTKFTADNIRDRLDALTAAEVANLITRLVENAAAFQSAWAEHKQEIAQATKPKRRSPQRTKQQSAPAKTNAADLSHRANGLYAGR